MTIAKRDRIYGYLIVDFVNAKTTDEAGMKYFENIQKVFGFQSGFVNQARGQFPTYDHFYSSFNNVEKKCFELILDKRNIELGLLAAVHADFLHYDVHSKIIHICESVVPQSEEGLCIGKTKHKEKYISIKILREMIKKYRADIDYKFIKENALKALPTLEKVAAEIVALKGISKKRYNEISKYEECYWNLNIEHYHIQKVQQSLRKFLNDIIQGKSLSDNKILKKILLTYNQIPKAKLILSKDGAIKDVSPFNENFFLDRGNRHSHEYVSQVYDGPISYCFAEYLRDQRNVDYLKKCGQCNCFFIAKDTRRQFCYEPKRCKKIHNNKSVAIKMKNEYRNPDSPKFKIDYLR